MSFTNDLQKTYKKYGEIDCIELSANPNAKYDIILFHGYGANYEDLSPLAHYLNHKNVRRWLFPNGVFKAHAVPMGRAWFPIDMQAIERAMMTGDTRDFSKMPPDIEVASEKVLQFFKEADIQPQKTIIGGFSQGAMLSTHLALKDYLSFQGLIVLSGTYLGAKEWELAMEEGAPIPFFQSHGRQDPVLPLEQAERLYNTFTAKQWHGEFHEFSGGHEIPPKVLQKAHQFISQTLH